eukprot:gene15864-21504_t
MERFIVVRHSERIDEVDKNGWNQLLQLPNMNENRNDPPITESGKTIAHDAGKTIKNIFDNMLGIDDFIHPIDNETYMVDLNVLPIQIEDKSSIQINHETIKHDNIDNRNNIDNNNNNNNDSNNNNNNIDNNNTINNSDENNSKLYESSNHEPIQDTSPTKSHHKIMIISSRLQRCVQTAYKICLELNINELFLSSGLSTIVACVKKQVKNNNNHFRFRTINELSLICPGILLHNCDDSNNLDNFLPTNNYMAALNMILIKKDIIPIIIAHRETVRELIGYRIKTPYCCIALFTKKETQPIIIPNNNNNINNNINNN